MNIVQTYFIEIYVRPKGKKPFVKWLDSLKDKTHRYRIKERLDRLSLGNMGDVKSIHRGISELKLAFGPGYRIYFAQVSDKNILLLCGGDKSSQKRDITRAINYWKDYLLR